MLSEESFHKNKHPSKKNRNYRRADCISCRKKGPIGGRRLVHPQGEQRRFSYDLVRFGITVEFYDGLLDLQNNSCAVCEIHISQLEGRLHVDHEHARGFIRGLLCGPCNLRVGRVEGTYRPLRVTHPMYEKTLAYILNEGIDY